MGDRTFLDVLSTDSVVFLRFAYTKRGQMSPPLSSERKIKPLPVWKSFGASATAACTAELLTIPLDTAKVSGERRDKSAELKCEGE